MSQAIGGIIYGWRKMPIVNCYVWLRLSFNDKTRLCMRVYSLTNSGLNTELPTTRADKFVQV